MKKLSILLLVASAVAVLFSSCNKEYAEPTITWTPDRLSNYVTIGDETTYNVTLDITFTAEAGISNIEVYKYIYEGEDYTTVAVDGPTGYTDLTSFNWTLTTQNVESDFAGGVTEIVYEVIVTDASETPQTKSMEYTFTSSASYNVTMIIEDEDGTLINDATVTFDGVVKTADYTFNYITEGTYEYSVVKEGFESVNVTDFVMPSSDTTFTVVLVKELSAYSANVLITQEITSTYATYDGTRVEDTENTVIGVKYHTNTASTIVIQPTTNCEGWVIVDNDSFTTATEIETAYTNGTPVTEYELPFDYDSKAFEAKYFISKVNGAYLLVKYVDGFVNPNDHDGNLGNVIVFQYKD